MAHMGCLWREVKVVRAGADVAAQICSSSSSSSSNTGISNCRMQLLPSSRWENLDSGSRNKLC